MPRKQKTEPAPIGEKIRSIRQDRGITLEQLANETGQSIATLEKIESGNMVPPVGTLLSISRALEVESSQFLKQPEASKESRVRAFRDRTTNYAYETLSPGAQHKHLKAFKITIEASRKHEGVGYSHEGEEFVYVLSGAVDITVGEHVNHLEKGESLHFNSGVAHHLVNPLAKKAELLVVIYAP